MQPILVTGGQGQLASCLRECAAARRLPLVTLSRPELDLEDPASVERSLSPHAPSAIVNAAAYTAVDQAETGSSRAHLINCDGPRHLAAAAARRGIPFIHISSDYVFDGRKPSPYCECDATAPLGAYGRSKLAGEAAVLRAHPAAVVFRASWVYSAHGHNFVRTMLRLSLAQPTVRVVSDQVGCPTSAADLADALLDVSLQLAANPEAGRQGVYHLAARGETTWFGFAEAIFDGWSRRGHRVPAVKAITTAEFPTAARRPANSRLDSSKAEREFGIRLRPWREALEDCLTRITAERTCRK